MTVPRRPGFAGPSSAAARSESPSSASSSRTRASSQPSGRSRWIACHWPTRLMRPLEHKLRSRGEGRAQSHAQRGAGAHLPARDAPDQALRGEGRGAVPRRGAAGIPACRDRPGGGRGRRLPGAGRRRRLRVDPPRARAHARARHAPERGHGGAVREARGLLARLRRLDAPLRRRARQPRRERGRRRRASGDHRRGARVQAARPAARGRRVLRRRGDQHRHVPRVAEPRAALEGPGRLRLREQPLGRVDPGRASSCRSRT